MAGSEVTNVDFVWYCPRLKYLNIKTGRILQNNLQRTAIIFLAGRHHK